jgi:hypothetical protein
MKFERKNCSFNINTEVFNFRWIVLNSEKNWSKREVFRQQSEGKWRELEQ